MKRTLIALLAATAILCAAAVTACAEASAESQPAKYTAQFAYVHDWSEPKVPSGMVRIKQEMDARASQEAAEAEKAAQEAWEAEQAYYADYSASYAPSYSGDGFQQEGIREYEGRTESWYSSQAAYHYRTNEWTVDDEGYYRDDAGHYVVAASDMEEGTVFQGSKGECIVLDGGCEEGVTDYYVAW